MKILLLAALLLGGCASQKEWSATGTVLEVYSGRNGWVTCSDCYTVIFQQDDGVTYSISNLEGPPPVWKGLHGRIRVAEISNGGSFNRKIVLVQR